MAKENNSLLFSNKKVVNLIGIINNNKLKIWNYAIAKGNNTIYLKKNAKTKMIKLIYVIPINI